MPKKKIEGEVTEISEESKQAASLESQVESLRTMVEQLTTLRAGDQKDKAELEKKISKQDEIFHPEQGPGPGCEAFKIHKGEALQLHMSDEAGIYEPIPSGFKVILHDLIPFLIRADLPDNRPFEEGMVANCRSMYTEKYKYFKPRKPGQKEREQGVASLCRKHAKVLLGMSEDHKALGINEIK